MFSKYNRVHTYGSIWYGRHLIFLISKSYLSNKVKILSYNPLYAFLMYKVKRKNLQKITVKIS